tara:strand:+ start:686 stop:1117 length:432 start_codon:yes stop_codon:yes gene_type:complete
MSIHRITQGDKSTAGIDSSGEIVSITGYTYSRNMQKDSNGHYVISEPETIDPENKDCFSKKIDIKRPDTETLTYRYYVKSGLDGSLFDPWGMFSEGTQASYAKRQGKSSWTFKKVSKECFDFYNNFLKSRNAAWLKNAERENE